MRAAFRVLGLHGRAFISLALIAAIVEPRSVGAQATTSGSAASARPQLSEPLRSRIDRIADSAAAHGVPADPLFMKAAEGVLKGADESRIVEAVRRLALDLESARGALGPAATNAELVAGASVIHAGVSAARLHDLAAASARPAGTSLVMPLVVFADLLERKVTADVATSAVAALLRRGAVDAEFVTLRSAIERDIASGKAPDASARVRTDAVLHSLGSGIRPPLFDNFD
jgi:hypothetical protein